MHGKGGMHGGGHAWQGGVHEGGIHGRGGGVHGRGVCMAGGMCGGGCMHGRGACVAEGRGACMPCTPPPPARYYEIQTMSRRYASYWNAFLS